MNDIQGNYNQNIGYQGIEDLLPKIQRLRHRIGAIKKDSVNPYYHSAYMDINTLIKELNPLLFDEGLLLTQPIIDNKVYSIITDISSGESISSALELPELDDPQKIGSAITYYRRYSLKSLLGLEEEDDDANYASLHRLQPSLSGNSTQDREQDKPWLNKTIKGTTELTPEWKAILKRLDKDPGQLYKVKEGFRISNALHKELVDYVDKKHQKATLSNIDNPLE